MTDNPVTDLDQYLALIDTERNRRPAEAMLVDEITRLREENDDLRGRLPL